MPRTLTLGLLALLLASCSLLPGTVNATLNGEWQLQDGSNQGQPIPIVPGTHITLKIDGSEVGGSAACNIYGGTIEINGTAIRISTLSMTEMACQDDVMASEAAYLAALPNVTAAARNGNNLVLSGPQVKLQFALVPAVSDADLVGPIWVLDSLISGGAVSSTVGEQATLQLNADGTISGTTGCRMFSGRYVASDNQVQVADLAIDKRGCAKELVAQDEQVLAVIRGGFGVTIDGDRLTLSAGDKGLGYRLRT